MTNAKYNSPSYANWAQRLELIDEILEFLDRKDLFLGHSWYNVPLELPFELRPEDFMKFAKEDLDEKSERSLINALSNIKRAIDCRIAGLLVFFGIFKKAKKEEWSFPRSTDFLLKVGVIAPPILKKINQKRNQMEHDFKKPLYDDVNDFLSVATLFLGFTNQFLHKTFLGEIEAYPDDGEGLPYLRMKHKIERGQIEFEFTKIGGNCESLTISIDDEKNYAKALNCLVKAILNR